ncbi:type II toxin-antitoxin system HicA family toxin [Streptococcus danieliae]|uniref:Type II toxin-antitoxin system HicA family toxin n=1 Tax=Streptococcus danieliae TaxID=747656 RepID=A0A7Z0LDM0_9STRE|nr:MULTISPECIES: type II toxin-antitoxin system HicA family toxin [Streptococcus]MBF0717482.1 type II toxin-antitoxin system HicA family toxin [Streptococcus danieliae]MBF0806468.1 type II toxin-antitoxin system HicA family toxin [Streptococcus sp. 19428wA2_WM07]NYS49412.1 type II toxin-antitoxin system HicA family toxin [Streptococcus danieliae]TFU27906.1 type II toxin-antitoxin system HicA family toxin [Streptococcus sp. WM07]
MTTRREIEKLAKKAGFYPTVKGKGSHTLWQHPDGRNLLISNPKEKDYRPGTLSKMLSVLNQGEKGE